MVTGGRSQELDLYQEHSSSPHPSPSPPLHTSPPHTLTTPPGTRAPSHTLTTSPHCHHPKLRPLMFTHPHSPLTTSPHSHPHKLRPLKFSHPHTPRCHHQHKSTQLSSTHLNLTLTLTHKHHPHNLPLGGLLWQEIISGREIWQAKLSEVFRVIPDLKVCQIHYIYMYIPTCIYMYEKA